MKRISSNEDPVNMRKKMFFYAEDDVRFYDSDANLNTPRYSELISGLIEFTKAMLNSRFKNNDLPSLVFIDIGSGTGACSLPILEQFPNTRLVAVDMCPPMHEVLRAKAVALFGENEAKERIRYVEGDIALGGTHEKLKESIHELCGMEQASFCVSGLALHHLTSGEKESCYRGIFQLLTADGFYLNADFFGFRDANLNRQAQEHTLEWIRRQHDSNSTNYPVALDRVGEHAEDLSNKWIEHCESYNIILPLDHSDDPDFPGDVDLLTKAGFSSAECVYRWWQTAISAATC